MTYQTEFPDFPAADMPTMPGGFVDTSWGNDVCPSFINDAAGLAIFVDYPDDAMREFPGGERFTLHTVKDGTVVDVVLETSIWQDIIAAVTDATRMRPARDLIVILATVDYEAGYLGIIRRSDMDGPTYERGMTAGMVAAWCGVDLSGGQR